MNEEMDLRSVEFINSRRLFNPGMLKILSTGLVIAAIIGACYGGNVYSGILKNSLLKEESFLRKLDVEVYPLLKLSEETARLEAIYDLKKEINSSAIPLPQYLENIQYIASINRASIKTITIDNSGTLAITGQCRELELIDLYRQSLIGLPFIVSAGVNAIDMDKENEYRFEITGTIKTESRANGND